MKRYEIEHQQRLQQLNNTADAVLTSFSKLEKRVNKIAHVSMSAGQVIESSSQAQDQARFAQFIIRCFLDLNTGDLSRVDPILTSTDERRIIEAGKLIQLLQSISDELTNKPSKNGRINDDDEMAAIDEEEEENGKDDTGLFGTKVSEPKVSTLSDGSTQTVTIVYEANGSYTTTTTTTTPDGVTTTVVETVETVTTNSSEIITANPRDASTFAVAAQTIKYLSTRIEQKLIDKFRLALVHKDYTTAFTIAGVLYTFKDHSESASQLQAQLSAQMAAKNAKDGNKTSAASVVLGKKFAYYSQDVLTAMRIPFRAEKKDLASARVFTIWFTRTVTSIIDVLRDQCLILPLILPNAVQTFEDVVLAVFQSYIPRLIQTIIDHPSLQNAPQKSLRTRATMFDLTRRAICEVICMYEDLNRNVEKRNLEQRQKSLMSNDLVKFKQSVQGGLLYQLSTYQENVQNTELGTNLIQTELDMQRLNQQQKKPNSLTASNNAPSFVYGYLAAAMQSMAAEAAQNTQNLSKDGIRNPKALKNKMQLASLTTTTGTTTASVSDKVAPKSFTDIDNCLTVELTPVAAILRDNITMSINSFADDWFDLEQGFLKTSLKQVRDDYVIGKWQLEKRLADEMYQNRSFFTVPREILLNIKAERKLWLQQYIMDIEPIDFVFRTLTGCIKRAQVISPISKRPEHIELLFNQVADFLYSTFLYPMVSEGIIRYSPWGSQLLRWNQDFFYTNPTHFAQDIAMLYHKYPILMLQRDQTEVVDEYSQAAKAQETQRLANPSLLFDKNGKEILPPPKAKSFYDMNTEQKQFQLHSLLPSLQPPQMRFLHQYILQAGNVDAKTFEGVTDAAQVRAEKEEKKSLAEKMQEKASSAKDSVSNAVVKAATAVQDVKDDVKEKKDKKKDDENLHEESRLDLSHSESMLDMFFVLTVLKSCIDIDKRLSSYLSRIVFPHLTNNLHLRSLAQIRLDRVRGPLETKVKQYLECYAVYVSYGFDSILKHIPVGSYKLKTVDSIQSGSGTTKVTALWIQSAKLIESTSSAIIASLSGMNIDDFLAFFVKQVVDRLLFRISSLGGISQLGAPLLLQDLAQIQNPINAIGLPHLIIKFQELRSMSFLFFSPYNAIRTFLLERLGTMHIDMALVTTLVKSRADYYSYKTQLHQQLDQFQTTITSSISNTTGTGQ